MPTPSKRSKADVAAENALLRSMIDQASVSAQAMAQRIAAGTTHTGQLLVGIRNISDMTLGQKSPNSTEPDLHLHADFGTNDPNSVAVISNSWWLQMRKGRFVRDGLIMRDDTALGLGDSAAPPDRETDLHPDFYVNAIPDITTWMDGKTEADIREAVAKMTSPASLLRLRRIVDIKLLELEKDYDVEDPLRMKKAQKRLPMLYKLVDELVTMRLERPEDDDDAEI
jgi:hypothetical protein